MDYRLAVLVPVLSLVVVFSLGGEAGEVEVVWDPSGYILYCPCMGEYFLYQGIKVSNLPPFCNMEWYVEFGIGLGGVVILMSMNIQPPTG
jgi:hypothetical protein